MHYVSETEPEYSVITERVLLLPSQKVEVLLMNFITKDEFTVMLNVCNTNTFIGARDKLMMLIMYDTDMHVSELLEHRYL